MEHPVATVQPTRAICRGSTTVTWWPSVRESLAKNRPASEALDASDWVLQARACDVPTESAAAPRSAQSAVVTSMTARTCRVRRMWKGVSNGLDEELSHRFGEG